MSAGHYNRLSAADKEAIQRDRIREPALACPYCETQTTVKDLLAHVIERCRGRRPPHPHSRWVGAAEVRDVVSRATLRRWAKQGLVHARRRPGGREYLLRDVVRIAALRRRRLSPEPAPPPSSSAQLSLFDVAALAASAPATDDDPKPDNGC